MEETTIIENKKKPFSWWRLLKRLFFSTVISGTVLTLLSVLLVFIYEDDVKNLIIKELNKHLKTEVRIDPKNIDLTILKSFPNCALEFKEFTAMDSKEFSTNDTLLHASRLALSFNIKDLFNKNYTIKKIELENAQCYLKQDKLGHANYLVWKSDSSTTATNDSLSFALEHIALSNIKLTYKSNKQKIKLNTHIKHLNFRGAFNNSNYILVCNGQAFVELFQIEKTAYINHKQIVLDVECNVNEHLYTITKANTKINETELLSNGSFKINDSLEKLDITFKGNHLDIASTLSLLPEKYQTKISNYKSEGMFYATGEAHYKAGNPIVVNAEFGIKQANIIYQPSKTTLSNVNLTGKLIINHQQSHLALHQISANLNSNTFSGNVDLRDFDNPYLTLDVVAKTTLEELIAFYPIDTLESISGNLNANAHIEGLISELQNNSYSPTIKANGEANLLNIKAKFKQSEKEINIPEGRLSLNERHLNVFGLKIIKGNSDLMFTGEAPQFLGYLFDPKTPLLINANVNSNKVELEDLIFENKNSNASGSIVIPDNIELNITTNIQEFTFAKFSANHINGALLLKNQKIAVKDLNLNTTDGAIKLNAFADASTDNISISGNCELQKLNIQKLFSQLNNFGQTTLEDKHLRGFVTASIDFTGNWDKTLKVDLNSINVTSSILIERGELIGFKPLESLAKYIDVNELKHIKFSTLQSTIDIKNKMIIIPKTSIKSTAINLDLWGKHSFDNMIDYHIQLLISEILSKKPRPNSNFDEELSLVENDPENRRSVFLVMAGPIDNPSIKYDRKGAKEKIKDDLKQEKQNLKNILKKEFGLFKKDSTKTKETEKANQKFNIQFGDEAKKNTKTLTPKKKEEDDDF